MNFSNLKRFYLFLSILMMGSFLLVNFISPKMVRTNIVDGDGVGHYAYLPAIFIYHSVDFTPVYEYEKEKRSLEYQGHYFYKYEDILINKYSCGTALLQLPYFLLAWLVTLILGLNADGYNVIFQLAVSLSALTIVFLGFVYLIRLMQIYSIKKWVIFASVLGGLFGTNLFHYTFIAPSMSHAYSFGLISIFLYYVKLSFTKYERSVVWTSAFLLGLIILVRPVNLIVISIIPFLADSPKNFLSTIKVKIQKPDFIPAAILFLVAISPQLIINYLQTGQLIIFSYKDEGFYFDRPEAINFLFSYRKGWFIYTPLMLLIIPALISIFKQSGFRFWSALVSLTVIVYVFSSWWNWLYGNSFGMRPMVDYYGYFLMLIALMLNRIKSTSIKILVIIFSLFSIFLNLFQTNQYVRGIIHPDSMNREAYWYVFLKSGDKYKNAISYTDEYYYGKLSEKPYFNTKTNLPNQSRGWKFNPSAVSEKDGKHFFELNSEQVFSPTYHYSITPEMTGKKNLYVVFSTDYLEHTEDAALGTLFVIAIDDKYGDLLFYKTFRLKRLPGTETDVWKEGSIGFKLPEITVDMEKASFYLWNINGKAVDIKNLALRFYTYQP